MLQTFEADGAQGRQAQQQFGKPENNKKSCQIVRREQLSLKLTSTHVQSCLKKKKKAIFYTHSLATLFDTPVHLLCNANI